MTSVSRFGRLWGRSHETFPPSVRRILSIKGPSATTYLQGLVTSDMNQDPEPVKYHTDIPPSNLPPEEDPIVEFNPKLRATCFLDNKGRILTDSFLWKQAEDHYLVDVSADAASSLLKHLQQYKLRRTKVDITDVSEQVSSHIIYGTLNAGGSPPGYVTGLDPRHPTLGMRVLSMEHPPEHFPSLVSGDFPSAPGTYDVLRKFSGIAEGSELMGKTALEANQEWLGAISFHKGCYLGQELTARSHFTGVIRKRILPVLLVDIQQEIPRPWIMSHLIQDEDSTTPEQLEGQPPLPKLSAPAVGATTTMLSFGSLGHEEDQKNEEEMAALQNSSDAFLQEINGIVSKGVKITDTSDDKTIGQIVSSPAAGSTVILAQMRLDRIGYGDGTTPWRRTNRIRLGETEKEYRYLPYLPHWWPNVDKATGKAQEESAEEKTDEEPDT